MPIISSPNENVTLCPESEDWDWWLKLPPSERGELVSGLRKSCHSKIAPSKSEPSRLEALARAMCIAAGNDPEAKVVPAAHTLQRLSGNADYVLIPTGFEVIPAWRVWSRDAEAVLSVWGGSRDISSYLVQW